MLASWVRSPSIRAGLAQRAWIVLLAGDGLGTIEIVRRTAVSKPTVIVWKKRYAAEGIGGLEDRPSRASRGPRTMWRSCWPRWSRRPSGWGCESETLLGYTARATAFETAVSMSAAYSIYSAAAHAEWHAVIAGFGQEAVPGGGTILVSRPDLVAVGGAVLAAAGFAIVPAGRALRLLGRTARLAEFGYHARRAEDLIHCLGLPEEWSRWRR